MKAEEALQRVQEAETLPELRVYEKIEIGDRIQQGDVYVTRIEDDAPLGEPWAGNQVAVGDTQGSRHTVHGASIYHTPEGEADDLLPSFSDELLPEAVGPRVDATDTWVLRHPEHAHHELHPGRYQISYQIDARTLQRVRD